MTCPHLRKRLSDLPVNGVFTAVCMDCGKLIDRTWPADLDWPEWVAPGEAGAAYWNQEGTRRGVAASVKKRRGL